MTSRSKDRLSKEQSEELDSISVSQANMNESKEQNKLTGIIITKVP